MNAKSSDGKNKKYRLIIDGLQFVDGERLENRIDTTAVYHKIRDKIYLFYDEYQEDGSVQSCRLTITSKEVELKKTGNGISILRFRENTRQECRYQSPMGELSLIADTHRLQLSCSEEERPHIQVELEYSLYMGASKMSDYQLKIKI